MDIHEILTTVSLVQQVKSGIVLGSATGFFYTRRDDLFLTTNRHVVVTDDPDTLRLRLHKNPNDLTDNDEYDVPLYATGNPVWKTPPHNANADVALIKLDKTEITSRFTVNTLSADQFLPERYPLHPGEDVFVMGYPLGYHDEIHNLPVCRNAMIASAYGVPFKTLPCFLTDANLHAGTSGSPVITKPKTAWVNDSGGTELFAGSHYYLVGIHSGTVAPGVTGGIPVGLGAAWYAKLIEDTAASF